MNRLIGRYPRLNRGLVLLVTLLLPPTTAAAVLHALACERVALVAPQSVESRPSAEASALATEDEEISDAIEPTAPASGVVAPAVLVTVLPSLTEKNNGFLSFAPTSPALRVALARRSAPRAPPA